MKYFIWLIPFLIINCANAQQSGHKWGRKNKDKNTEEKKDTIKDKGMGEAIAKLFAPKPPKVLTVAILLPFHTDLLQLDSMDLTLKRVPYKSILAIHYYEGILMALDSLDKLGLKLKVKIYDCHGDSSDTKKVLNKPELKEADFVVGPIMNSSLMVAARFAKENKKYLFSPLSAVTTVKDNPYFIIVNATLRSHCETMVNYIESRYKPRKVILLYRHNGPEDTYANYFKNTFEKDKAPFWWDEISAAKDSNSVKVEPHLSEDSTNVIVIPSFDEVFANSITRQLAGMADKYKLEVFGMPTWNDMESLRYDYLETIHAHITSSYWVNDSAVWYLNFKKQYTNRFNTLPIGYSIEGYDLMLYLGNLILKNGDDWADQLDKTTGTQLGDVFDFKGYTGKNSKEVQYIENQHVHILKYMDNKMVKVN